MTASSEPARRLVFLHGFTQTHHHCHDLAHRLAAALAGATESPPTTTFLDLPGHGLSAGDGTPIADAGPAIADVGGRGTYVGYSMGGRFALIAALAAPARVERLVLVGATAGIEDPTERAARRRSDDELADRIEDVGTERFLDDWLAAPLFATLPAARSGREHRDRNRPDGLATSLRTAGAGAMPPIWDELPRLRLPTLVIAGELDSKFAGIGRRMASLLPDAAFAAIPGAGHAAHIERPAQVASLIAEWWLAPDGRAAQPMPSPTASNAPNAS